MPSYLMAETSPDRDIRDSFLTPSRTLYAVLIFGADPTKRAIHIIVTKWTTAAKRARYIRRSLPTSAPLIAQITITPGKWYYISKKNDFIPPPGYAE